MKTYPVKGKHAPGARYRQPAMPSKKESQRRMEAALRASFARMRALVAGNP